MKILTTYLIYPRLLVSRDKRWVGKWKVNFYNGLIVKRGKVYGPSSDAVRELLDMSIQFAKLNP
jgi:hypothetical protein